MNYVEKPVRNAGWLRFSPQFLQARLSGRHHLQAALGNSRWLGGDRVIRMFGAVIVGTVVARYLGPTQFGFLSYATAIYGLFNIISNLGLDSLVVRDIVLD